MKVVVKREERGRNNSIPPQNLAPTKIELKNTATIEFEDRQAAPRIKALKGILPVKRVSTPVSETVESSPVQRAVSEVERKGKIDDEKLDLNVDHVTEIIDSKDAAFNDVDNEKEHERYLKILAALNNKNTKTRNFSPFPPLMEGTLTATKIVKPWEKTANEAKEKKRDEVVISDVNNRAKESMSVDTENKNGVKENVDDPQQLLQPSVASSDGSLPDEDEGVFAQPSMTMQQQSAGPASLIFIASIDILIPNDIIFSQIRSNLYFN